MYVCMKVMTGEKEDNLKKKQKSKKNIRSKSKFKILHPQDKRKEIKKKDI